MAGLGRLFDLFGDPCTQGSIASMPFIHAEPNPRKLMSPELIELLESHFPDQVDQGIVRTGLDYLFQAHEMLIGIQSEDFVDLPLMEGGGENWAIHIQHPASKNHHIIDGHRAHQMAWVLKELWQDIPLAMSPVRNIRMYFRIIDQRIYQGLAARHGSLPIATQGDAFSEFIGDVLTLMTGKAEDNNYRFGWWHRMHGTH